MRLDLNILGLPASILALVALHTTSVLSAENQSPKQWPYNLPPHVKYWPEDPPNRRRDLEAIEEHVRLGRSPVGVMKMSMDEGEKFYMEYWQFEGETGQTNILGESSKSLRGRDEGEEATLLANASAVLSFRPPFMLHTEDLDPGDLRARRAVEARNALAALEKRQFACPTGTAACTSIGESNYCCATGETCFAIQDTGLGPVGCCPTGSTCGGTVTSCNSPNTPCPQALGGGCCIPNYVCAGVGCVINPSLIVTTTITRTFTISASSSTQTSIIVVTTTTTSSSSTASTASTCTSSYQSCPASLGGGCCPTDRICASGTSCAPLSISRASTVSSSTTGATSTATGVGPVRPTSITTTSIESSITGTSCPTGFYACQAYYAGGCCRTGRDCQTTSCPPTSSTTIISGVATIVVPVGSDATVATPTGACATGWSTCAASDGGNCCPSGWQCGTASCSSVAATGTAVLQKESPNMGFRDMGMGSFAAALMAFVVGLMLL